MVTGLGKEREMMVGVLTHSSTARTHFWMQVQIPSLPQGEVKHQQPCFKNTEVFLCWTVQKLPYRKLGCQPGMDQHNASCKHPDLQLRAPHLQGDVHLKTPPTSPSLGLTKLKEMAPIVLRRDFSNSLSLGKVVFIRCLREVMLCSKGLQLLLDVL